VIAVIFQIEARAAAGTVLTALPTEMNLSARYMNSEIAGLNKSRRTLLWFNPATNQWGPAPKLVVDPTFNCRLLDAQSRLLLCLPALILRVSDTMAQLGSSPSDLSA
jgi:hypothetical protein